MLWPWLPGANARALYGLETEVGKVAEQSEGEHLAQRGGGQVGDLGSLEGRASGSYPHAHSCLLETCGRCCC